MDKPDETVAAVLRARLREADEEIGLPPGLWERIRVPTPEPRRAPRISRPALAVALAAVVVAAVALGSWWLSGPAPGNTAPPAGRTGVTLDVYNAETGCRVPRTTDCALRLAKDPRTRYAASGNRAGVVWHGDRVTALCAIEDGVVLRDESGRSSTRWYRVRTDEGVVGWLPGARTRDTPEVPGCGATETPRRQ